MPSASISGLGQEFNGNFCPHPKVARIFLVKLLPKKLGFLKLRVCELKHVGAPSLVNAMNELDARSKTYNLGKIL